MAIFTLETLKENYRKDTQKRPKNKSSNDAIIKVIDFIGSQVADPEKLVFAIGDISKGGLVNRGVACEVLLDMWLNGSLSSCKSLDGYYTTSKMVYKVKVSTSASYANYNPQQDLSNMFFINQCGIFFCPNGKENIILDKCGEHIKDITMKNVKIIELF